MTTIGIEIERERQHIDDALREVEPNKYYHLIVAEESYPDIVQEAWRIHARGYLDMGFVTREALTNEGFLHPSIDKARGSNVNYYLAINPECEDDCATMRKVHIPQGRSFRDLPAYKLTQETFYPGALSGFEDLEDQGASIVEIAALAKDTLARNRSVFEIFRETIQEALGKNEAWFFSMVTSTHGALIPRLGAANLRVLGDDVDMSASDSRVAEGVKVRPILVLPDKFNDNILYAYEQATREADKLRLAKSLIFYTDGLDRSQMSGRVFEARQKILSASSE
jgi:hypothetical protein